MKEIIVVSEIVLVDDEDYNYITLCYDLSINENGYVQCKIKDKFKRKGMGFYSNLSLHKLLIHPDKTGRGIDVDHRDKNPLNNQKDNLRVCTHKENSRNRRGHKTYAQKETYSKYKGVTWNKEKESWQGCIKNDNGYKYLGNFTNEVAAANAYNFNAIKYFGEFAELNDCEYMDVNEWKKYRYGKNKTSKYIGVSLVDGKYVAQIWNGKRNIVVGRFDNEIDAAKAYNEKAIELKGIKAKINQIEDN